MMKKSGGVKIIIIGLVIAAIVIVYFYYLANKTKEMKGKDVESTLVQTTLLRNLDKNYPPSPKEVVSYFNELARCLYNEKYTDDEFDALALKARDIYDEDLNANKTIDQYREDLKSDIEGFKALDQSILAYQLPASTEVERYEEDGNSCARLYCNYTIRKGTQKFSSDVVFILRQDEDKRWKIFGWAESK